MVEEFPILYKRAKTGKIQQWEIIVTPFVGGEAQIVITQGQLNGKLQIYNDIISEGKNLSKANETTPYEQACLEAKSKWNAKKDQGYKDLDEIGFNNDMAISCIGENAVNIFYDYVDRLLPKDNTDASGNIKPMLAQSVKKDFKNVQFPCIVQPKLDGVRCLCIITKDEHNLEVKFLSRSGKEYTTLGHIAFDIVEMFGWTSVESMILDGEIYCHKDITFQQITSAVKKTNDNTCLLKFAVYDIVSDKPQIDRVKLITELLKDTPENFSVTKVRSYRADDAKRVQKLFADFIADGYEGAMIRHMNAPYEHTRSKNLLKYKEFDSDEFYHIGWELGKRGVEDLIAICKTNEGVVFKAKMQGNKEEKEKLYKYMPRVHLLTVKYFGKTDDGSIRFPIGVGFRDYEN